MTALSKESILNAGNAVREKVEVPEWGGCVYIGEVSAKDWMESQDAALKDKEDGRQFSTAPWIGRILAKSIVDENGNRIFSDEDASELMKKPLTIINRLYRIADKVNDFTGRGVKDAEKNSVEGAGENLSSPSPEN